MLGKAFHCRQIFSRGDTSAGIADQTPSFSMVRIAENKNCGPICRLSFDESGDFTNLGTGGIKKWQRLPAEKLTALGRNPMGAYQQAGIGLRKGAVIFQWHDSVGCQIGEDAAVVDQVPIGQYRLEGPAQRCGPVDGAADALAKAGEIAANYSHKNWTDFGSEKT